MSNSSMSKAWLYAIALPFCLIIPQVFIDLAHGILGADGRAGFLSIGVVTRGLLVIIAFFALLKIRAPELKVFLSLLLYSFLFSNLVWILISDVYSFGHELNQAVRIAFPWLIAGAFLYLNQKIPLNQSYLIRLIAWVGFVTALSLLASTALGVNEKTYGDWSYGSKGLFTAQNDLGLTLVLTLVAAVTVFVQTRKILHLIIIITIIVAGFFLGTRTGVLGPAIVLVAFVGASFLNPQLFTMPGQKSFKFNKLLLLVPVFVAIAGSVIFLNQIEKTDYLMKRIYSLAEETPRSKLEAAGIARLEERRVIFTFIGEGGLAFKKHVAEKINYQRKKADKGAISSFSNSKKLSYSVHRVENDLIDIIGFYGFLQFFIIYGALALVYLIALRKAIRNWNLENVALLIIFTLFLAHSTLAGHGIFSAQVATVMAPIFFLQLRDLHWSRATTRSSVITSGGATSGMTKDMSKTTYDQEVDTKISERPFTIILTGTDPEPVRGGIGTAVAGYRHALMECDHFGGLIPTFQAGSTRGKIVPWLRAIPALRKTIRQYRKNGIAVVVYGHAGPRMSLLRESLILLWARLCGARTMLQLHTPHIDRYMNKGYARLLLRLAFSPVDQVTTLSPWWQSRLADGGFNGTIVVPNPVSQELEQVANMISTNGIPSAPAGKTKQLVVLAMARLTRGKGVHLAIEALPFLPSHIVLRIAGDGPELKPLKKLSQKLGVAERVQFLGWISGEEKLQQLSATDVFCAPSNADAFSMGMIEALSYGLPVVTIQAKAAADLVKDGKTGFVVEANNSKAIADAILKLDDTSMREQMAVNGATWVVNELSGKTVGTRIKDAAAGVLAFE